MKVATGGGSDEDVQWSEEFESYSAFTWESPEEYGLSWQPPGTSNWEDEENGDD